VSVGVVLEEDGVLDAVVVVCVELAGVVAAVAALDAAPPPDEPPLLQPSVESAARAPSITIRVVFTVPGPPRPT
jgi:hypothetical protein